MILNRNEALYPYHKWLLAETQRASLRPEGFLSEMNWLTHEASVDDL